MSKAVEQRHLLRVGVRRTDGRRDHVVVEEPLEVRVSGKPLAVIMRTPGNDFELAAGFLVTEGILRKPADLGTIGYCPTARRAEERNVVEVRPRSGVRWNLESAKRNLYASSSCGLCGKATIEAIHVLSPPIVWRGRVSRELICRLPGVLRDAQETFRKTGGLHAAGIFDLEGNLLCIREDVGRHNAVDKTIGAMLLEDRFPLDRHILMVSGRAGFEITQKALVARIPVVAAVSAPSTLAVDLARRSGMTLVGFLRGRTFNVYAGVHRISR